MNIIIKEMNYFYKSVLLLKDKSQLIIYRVTKETEDSIPLCKIL